MRTPKNIYEALDRARATLEHDLAMNGRRGRLCAELELQDRLPSWVFQLGWGPLATERLLRSMGLDVTSICEQAGVLRYEVTDLNDGNPERALDGRVGHFEVTTELSSRARGLGVLTWETHPQIP